MATIQIYNDDCLDILPTIPDKSVDIVICDLPYGQTSCHWDTPIDLQQLWIQLKRVARDSHTPFFFFTTTKFGYKLIQSNEQWFRYDLVVQKSKPAGFLNVRRMPLRTHEMLYVFYDKLPVYNIPRTIKKEDFTQITTTAREKTIYGHLHNLINNSQYIKPLPQSILKMKTNNGKYHNTEKGQDILEWIIKYYSNEGDTVLDPTMGSGSTGVACQTLGRNFIGIEKDQDIYKIAEKRLNI